MIYKYYSKSDFNTNAILENYFWFAKHGTLNDPFDMAGDLFYRFPTFLDEIKRDGYEDLYRTAIQNMAICCFSHENNNMHFWSLYTGSHSGFVLGFDDNSFYDGFSSRERAKVIYHDCYYEDTIPDFNNLDTKIPNLENNAITTPLRALIKDERNIDQILTYYLLLKEKATWEIEKEKRMILGLNYINQHPTDKNGYKISWLDNTLKEVIWGYRIDPEYKRLIKKLLPEGIIEKEVSPRHSGLEYSLSINSCTGL